MLVMCHTLTCISHIIAISWKHEYIHYQKCIVHTPTRLGTAQCIHSADSAVESANCVLIIELTSESVRTEWSLREASEPLLLSYTSEEV